MRWTNVVGWPAYQISESGLVRRLKQSCGAVSGRTLQPWLRRGYEAVHLSADGNAKYVSVHRLVYESFTGPIPQGMVINHLDGDKRNNHFKNLEVTSIGGNLRHAAALGLTNKGERNHASKLTDEKVKHARDIYFQNKATIKELALEFGVSCVAMRLAVNGDTWKHITAS